MMSSLAPLEQHVMSGEDSGGGGGSGSEGDGHNGLYPDGRVRSLAGPRACGSQKVLRFDGE